MAHIKRRLIACLIGWMPLFSSGQQAPSKPLPAQLIAHGAYTRWYGQAPMHEDGMEIEGYTDVDKRIRFGADSMFEEIIFKDFFQTAMDDTCARHDKRANTIILYTGRWDTSGDTILLHYQTRSSYQENPFLDCFSRSGNKLFHCDTAPDHTCEVNKTRSFLLKKEALCEVADDAECYR